MTVIDGITNQTTTIGVGNNPQFMVVNPATNKVYVTNRFDGTVSVINGANNTVTATLTVGAHPVGVDVNPLTNKIYVANFGNRLGNTVSVIDGSVDQVVATVTVQYAPIFLAVNSATNKIYVANRCANDPNDCKSDGSAPNGTVSVIDGATNAVSNTVPVGKWPSVMLVNKVTDKIYVGNACGNDSNCILSGNNANTIGTVTAIDGATLTTATVDVGKGSTGVTVNQVSNEIYVSNATDNTVTFINGTNLSTTAVAVGAAPADVEVNPDTYRIYVTNSGDNTVTMINGNTHAKTNVGVGGGPSSAVVNPVTNRIYEINSTDNTVSVIAGGISDPLQFVPVTPCRLVDTRPQYGGSGSIPGGTAESFILPQQGTCGHSIPANAAAFSLNVTAIPSGRLGFLSIFPTGELQPVVSTMNSLDGRTKANAAIVPAGYQGAISVYVSSTSDVALDIDGYFIPANGSTLAYYPLTPCRMVDTRTTNGPLGGPFLNANQERDFPVLDDRCGIPNGVTPVAYSFNVTAVPNPAGQRLGFLTVWPKGRTQPGVSTLNNVTGTYVANAAIVPAGTNGEVAVFPNNTTDLVIDIVGYFATPGTGGLSFYPAAPCRVLDTRGFGNGQPFSGEMTVNVASSQCAPPSGAEAYVFNATVIPQVRLGFLTLWPDGDSRPLASTLNAIDGAITSNMAIVPTSNGKVDTYATDLTQLLMDISGFYAH